MQADRGLAVQIREIDDKRSIVIAGQSRNKFLADPTSTVKSNDVVLLIVSLFNGNLLDRIELFGGTGEEGELRGNVDLHLSHKEEFPIIPR